MGRICWCPIYIVMKGQKKAEDFQSRSLIWSWLDRGFELSGPVPKKNPGQLVGMKTQTKLLCVPSQSHLCWEFFQTLTEESSDLGHVFSSVHLSQPKANSDLASSSLWFPPTSFILNLYVFTSNALLQNLHHLIFTPFSKASHYFLLCFSLSLLLFSWTCYLHDNIICLIYCLVLAQTLKLNSG